MRGRKPKPIEDHIKNGTYQPVRHGTPAMSPEVLANVPEMPDNLPKQCKNDWHRVCSLLHGNGILTGCDLDAIGRYVFLLEMEERAKADLDKSGPTVKLVTKHGEQYRPHPAFRVLMECGRELRAISEKWGFDPASRQRIHVTPPAKKTSILDLMKGGRKVDPADQFQN